MVLVSRLAEMRWPKTASQRALEAAEEIAVAALVMVPGAGEEEGQQPASAILINPRIVFRSERSETSRITLRGVRGELGELLDPVEDMFTTGATRGEKAAGAARGGEATGAGATRREGDTGSTSAEATGSTGEAPGATGGGCWVDM